MKIFEKTYHKDRDPGEVRIFGWPLVRREIRDYSWYQWTYGSVARCVVALALVLAAVIGSLVVGTNQWSKHVASYECRHWGEANGRPVKFVTYTFWSWDCLTPNHNAPGTWISTDNPTLLGS